MGSSYSVACGYGETKKQAARSLRSHLRFEWQMELYVENEAADLYYAKCNGKRVRVQFYVNQAYPNGAIKAVLEF
jgi:deoxyadenosine/deoxycytidine kinase